MAGKNYKIKITGQGYKVINKITDWYLKTADSHNIFYCIKLEINLRSDLWLSQFDNIYITGNNMYHDLFAILGLQKHSWSQF